MSPRLLVLAKTPVPGRVKTRLCPPCTAGQAAELAAAALADTLDAAGAARFGDRVLVVDGDLAAPAGWSRTAQRGGGLGDRIAAAFADTATAGTPALLIGMDTPQVTPGLLDGAAGLLARADAVLGPAEDGGWWALGLRRPGHAEAVRDVPMSTGTTGAETLAALTRRGLDTVLLPVLRDVDTIADARAVAELCAPGSRFAATLSRLPVTPR